VITRSLMPMKWPFWAGTLPAAVQCTSATTRFTTIVYAVLPLGSRTSYR
jgi:hypothetical protein